MKRHMILGGVIQPAVMMRAPADESIDLTTEESKWVQAQAAKENLTKVDMSVVNPEKDQTEYAQAMAAIAASRAVSPYLQKLAKDAEMGFVNLHTNNKENGRGDGKWYPFTYNKTQHFGEPEMTRAEATKQGIERGDEQ